MLESLLATLDARSRLVLRLYYEEDLTQAEIGRRLGYSQMHVSRLLRSAITKLAETAGREAREPRPLPVAAPLDIARSTESMPPSIHHLTRRAAALQR